MKKLAIALLFLLVSASPGLAQINVSVDIGLAPPPPRIEIVPEVRPGNIWIEGHWFWDGHKHVWAGGHFEKERPGYHWVPARWEQHGDRHHFEPGRWEANREERREHREERREHRDW